MAKTWTLLSLFTLLVAALCHRSLCASSSETEWTLAMIKPDGLSNNHTDIIKNIIFESGFTIIKEMLLQLDEANVTTFYSEHSQRSFFLDLIEYMTSGPIYVMVLEKVNAISEWRRLIGPTDARKARLSHPTSIRALCGIDSERNCVHGSDSPQSAVREITFFFPDLFPVKTTSLNGQQSNSSPPSGGATSVHDEL